MEKNNYAYKATKYKDTVIFQTHLLPCEIVGTVSRLSCPNISGLRTSETEWTRVSSQRDAKSRDRERYP